MDQLPQCRLRVKPFLQLGEAITFTRRFNVAVTRRFGQNTGLARRSADLAVRSTPRSDPDAAGLVEVGAALPVRCLAVDDDIASRRVDNTFADRKSVV